MNTSFGVLAAEDHARSPFALRELERAIGDPKNKSASAGRQNAATCQNSGFEFSEFKIRIQMFWNEHLVF